MTKHFLLVYKLDSINHIIHGPYTHYEGAGATDVVTFRRQNIMRDLGFKCELYNVENDFILITYKLDALNRLKFEPLIYDFSTSQEAIEKACVLDELGFKTHIEKLQK